MGDVELVMKTWMHLEQTSTIISNVTALYGWAWSMCKRFHGPSGNSQGCIGAVVILYAFANKLHTISFFQYLYTVLHGYQVCDCARAFILGIPDYPECISRRTDLRLCGGRIITFSHVLGSVLINLQVLTCLYVCQIRVLMFAVILQKHAFGPKLLN